MVSRLADEGDVLGRDNECDVNEYAGRNKQPPESPILGTMDEITEEEVARGGRRNDGEIEDVPLGVEEVVAEEDDRYCGQASAADNPVHEEQGRQKDKEIRRGKRHAERFYSTSFLGPSCGTDLSRGRRPRRPLRILLTVQAAGRGRPARLGGAGSPAFGGAVR